MAYIANIPMGSQPINVTQPQIQGNFEALGAYLNPNNTAIVFNEIVPPAPVTGANQGALFVENGVYTNVPELTFERQNGGPNIEMTACFADATGWTRIPSGILMKWGTVAVPGSPFTITFPDDGNVTIPRFTAIFVVIPNTVGNVTTITEINSQTITTFYGHHYGLTGNGQAGTISYIAIGT